MITWVSFLFSSLPSWLCQTMQPGLLVSVHEPCIWGCMLILRVVPAGIAAALFQASIYDVPGGYRAVMFDRFSGVKDKVVPGTRFSKSAHSCFCVQATPEGTHFLIPWLQRAILYDCRIKPRVRKTR